MASVRLSGDPPGEQRGCRYVCDRGHGAGLWPFLPLMLRMMMACAGTVRDDAGSLGGYLNLTHTSSGLWADIVAQGTRHSMKASSDNNDFRARGWGWLGSLETGLPFQYH